MHRLLTVLFSASLWMLFLVGCSTEKNTVINRTYHGINARYNGYFNATELINLSLKGYRSNLQEDYFSVLPLEVLPQPKDIESLYPAIDTAIVKCKKVITDHSMPNNDRPSKKKEEHNPWIDENWITIGQAYYYRRDYDQALKSFQFINKFYSNDPSNYVGELWMAKTLMRMNKWGEAKMRLDNLDKAIADQEERKNEKPSKSKKSKRSKSKDLPEPADFPKKARFELERTKAELFLLRNERTNAIESLTKSLEFAKKQDKGRVHFILGQLLDEEGKSLDAAQHYRKVKKYNVPYEMSFNAKIKGALGGATKDPRKELDKMLKDQKNAPYKDQIYYALAMLELNEGNEFAAIENLHNSAFYSTSNPRQKGMAYEKLGDLSFAKRKYVPAQKYYDSCANVIPETYPNYDGIKNKAAKLADLVKNVEIATYEDSLLMIAGLDPNEREKFIRDEIKRQEKEAQERKERDAARLRELQANENLFVQQVGSANKWYFNNAQTRADGYQDFVKLWGSRENLDHWRRSNKTEFLDIPQEGDSLSADAGGDSVLVEEVDVFDKMLADIPLSDSAQEVSYAKLFEALYNAGIIYKDQLNETDLAIAQFSNVIERNRESKYNLLSAYQLYTIYNERDPSVAYQHKEYILNNYPNSDYANFLRDPNYFIKKKEREKLAEQEYVQVLDRYGRGLYYPVQLKADEVIANEKDNPYRAKYMLLKALCMGKTSENKQSLVPVLEQVVLEYPDTDESKRAKELLDIIKNGYSENIPYDFSKKSVFKYEEKSRHVAIVFLDKDENISLAQNRISDFTKEYFKSFKLKVSSKLYGSDQNIIMIADFDDEYQGKEYLRTYKSTRKYLLDLQNARIILISPLNFKTLLETQKLQDYESFYDEYY